MLLVCIYANSQNVDSLKKLHFQNDSKLLYEIASGLLYTELDSATYYANKIIINKDKTFFSRAYDLIATANVIKGNFDTAKIIYETANSNIDFSSEDKNLIKALILLHQAQLVSIQGKNKEALGLLELTNSKLSNCIESSEKKKILMKFYSIKSDILSDIGQYGEAIELLNKAIPICLELKEKSIEASNYNRMAKCYSNINEYEKSIKYCEKAIAILKELNNYNAIARSYMLIAGSYLDLDSFKLAFKNICTAQSFAIKLNNVSQVAQLYDLKAQYYIRIDENKLALKVVDSALKLNKENELFLNVAANYSVIGNAYSQMGFYKKAIPYYEDAVKILNKESEWVKSKIIFRNLIDAYVKTGAEHKKLSNSLLLYDSVCNKVMNKEKISELTAQEIKYETSLKEQKIKEQQNLLEINKKKTNLILLSSILGIISLSSIFLYLRNKAKRKSLQTEKEKIDYQLDSIRGKILPHFSGNILNTITYFFESDQADKGVTYLTKFTELNKDILLSTKSPSRPLKDEIQFLNNYIELEKLRYQNNLQFEMNVDKSVNLETQIPVLILHTFCENAIRHGIMSIKGKGKLGIEIKDIKGGILQIKIIDDGIGLEEAKRNNIKSTGQGLEILSKQIELYNKNNQSKISFSLSEIENGNKIAGTQVLINIPHHFNYSA